MEDYWANLVDEFKVRRKMWSRMSIDFIKKCNIFLVPDQVEDEGEQVLTQYEQEKDKSILTQVEDEGEQVLISTH